jgi:hypothetical protein
VALSSIEPLTVKSLFGSFFSKKNISFAGLPALRSADRLRDSVYAIVLVAAINAPSPGCAAVWLT